MQKILNLLKKIRSNKAYLSLFFILFGLVLIFFPYMTLEILSAICGICVAINGIFTIIDYFKNKSQTKFGTFSLISGIIQIVIGLNFVVAAYMIVSLISSVFGIFLIYNGIKQIQTARENKRYYNSNSLWMHVFGTATIVIGSIMTFLKPFLLPGLILKIIGICLIYYGISILVIAHFNKKDESVLIDDDEQEK